VQLITLASGWRAALIRYGLPLALTTVLIGIHRRNWPVFDIATVATWKSVGEYLRAHSPADARVAADAAGAIPFYSQLAAIDMMGLADRTIAETPIATMGKGPAGHEKHNPLYVLSRKPMWITTWVTPHGALGPDLWNNVDLRQNYDLYALADLRDDDLHDALTEEAPGDRVVPIATDALSEFGLLSQAAPRSQRWGIWRRRDAPREGVVLAPADFAITNDRTAESAPFTFLPGRYRVQATISRPAAALTPPASCEIEVLGSTSQSNGVQRDTADPTGETLSREFVIDDREASRSRTIRLSCSEPWRGQPASASIATIR
jgi:hypothetical protein